MCAVGRERVVVTIEDNDSAGGEQGFHRGGLLDVCADGYKSLRVCGYGGTMGSIVV